MVKAFARLGGKRTTDALPEVPRGIIALDAGHITNANGARPRTRQSRSCDQILDDDVASPIPLTIAARDSRKPGNLGGGNAAATFTLRNS
jgi:hypothetical protein